VSDREKTRRIGDGSSHWPAVPPEPPREDGTAADTDRFQAGGCRDGWRVGVLLALIAFLVLGIAGVMVMISKHAGGGR